MREQPSLIGLRLAELAEILGDEGRPSETRARTLLRWLWRPGATLSPLPERLEGVSRQALRKLRERARQPDVRQIDQQRSQDGTVKLLLSSRGHPFETVMIPGRGRTTLCISSQSGCTRFCRFCATATMGFRANLTAGEIVAQVLLARNLAPADVPLRNVVFMGMGEPLDNFREVVRAVDVLCTPGGAGLSPGHVTVSTSGVLPAMARFVARSDACLAISLNGTSDEQRRSIMPLDSRWPIDALAAFVAEHGTGRVFFIEYVLLHDFNDGLEDARRLAGLLKGLNVRVNLIPYNPHPDSPFERPTEARLQMFFDHLNSRSIRTLVRLPRGQDIAAACGQLRRMHLQIDGPD